jgi:hypothetical protein
MCHNADTEREAPEPMKLGWLGHFIWFSCESCHVHFYEHVDIEF